MARFSDFLPKDMSARIADFKFDGEINILEPVFTSGLNLSGDCDEMVVSGDGNVSFLIKEQLHSVRFTNNQFRISKHVSLPRHERYKINPQGDVVISLSRSHRNGLCITCTKVAYQAECKLEEKINMDYEYSLNRPYDFCLSADRKICLSTISNDKSRSYLDIFSYNVSLKIFHDHHTKLPVALSGYSLNMYFTLCCTKLILCAMNECVVVYSLRDRSFGPVFHWDVRNMPNGMQCFYVYNPNIGNVLITCQRTGVVKALVEKNLHVSPLLDVALTEHEFPQDMWFIIKHVDFFDGIKLFVCNRRLSELFIFDYLERRIVGKFIPPVDHFISNVGTNWSGKEVIVLTQPGVESVLDPLSKLILTHLGRSTDDGSSQCKDLTLNVLLSNRSGTVPSLKQFAKLAVFQSHSLDELKGMGFPRNLKREMKLQF